MAQIVIMPGGFHPFHAGHMALYNSARKAFPQADLYVAATNSQEERPFPFAVKEKLAKVAGVEQGHFIQVKSPFQSKEITQNYDPENDVLIFVRSEKDRNESPKPGGIKKDGSPAYFQSWTGKNVQPFAKHAYFAYLPTVKFGPGITSATEIRKAWPTLNDKRKTAMVMSLYPVTQTNSKLAANVVGMLDQVMGGQEGVLEAKKKKKKKSSRAMAGYFFPGYAYYGGGDSGDGGGGGESIAEGTAKKTIEWSDLKFINDIDLRYEIFAESFASNHSILTESSDPRTSQYFTTLQTMSDKVDIDTHCVVVWLALVNDKVLKVKEPTTGILMSLNSNSYKIQLQTGEIDEYPAKKSAEVMSSITCLFNNKKSYDKFRTILSLKFDHELSSWESLASDPGSLINDQMTEGAEEALQYATQAHSGQTRNGGDPYITHPMRVADHIKQYKQSHNLDALISAAYLHDTIEDTDTTHEALHDLFGGLVASLVKELTSDPEQIKKMGKAQYLSHKMAAMSSYALVIKLADRLDNVKDITTAKTPQWRQKYKNETELILNYIEKTRALSGTHKKLIELIRAKLSELTNDDTVTTTENLGIPMPGSYEQEHTTSRTSSRTLNIASERVDYLDEFDAD